MGRMPSVILTAAPRPIVVAIPPLLPPPVAIAVVDPPAFLTFALLRAGGKVFRQPWPLVLQHVLLFRICIILQGKDQAIACLIDG